MAHEWLPQTPAELRTQAAKLQKLAAHVLHGDLAERLEEQAAELLAKAELKEVQERGSRLRPTLFAHECHP
jgi:hypothetical protein